MGWLVCLFIILMVGFILYSSTLFINEMERKLDRGGRMVGWREGGGRVVGWRGKDGGMGRGKGGGIIRLPSLVSCHVQKCNKHG